MADLPERLGVMDGSCSKKSDDMNFSRKLHFLKNVSRFKARYKKIQEIYTVFCISRYEALQENLFEKCGIFRLILNILPFLMVATSLYHK